MAAFQLTQGSEVQVLPRKQAGLSRGHAEPLSKQPTAELSAIGKPVQLLLWHHLRQFFVCPNQIAVAVSSELTSRIVGHCSEMATVSILPRELKILC